MNKVLLVGRLVRDPETNMTPSGIKYSRFTIAINRQFSETQTDFVPIVTWRNQADFVDRFIRKGFLVAVEGRFTSSTYENADRQKITRYEITADQVNGLETKSQVEARKSMPTIRNDDQSFNRETPLQFEDEPVVAQNKVAEDSKVENDVPWDIDL